MQRSLNLKFLLLTLVVLVLLAGATYALHEYQAVRTAPRVLARAEKFLAEKKPDFARSYFEQYLNTNPKDTNARAKLAILLDESENEDRYDVIQALQGVLREDPKRNDIRYRLLLALAKTHQIDAAIREAENLRESWKDKAEIEHILGWCLEDKQNYPDAAAAFRRSLAIDPSRVATAVLLTEVLDAQRKKADNTEDRTTLQDEMNKTMEQLVAKNPESAPAHLARYRYLRDRKQPEEAEKELALAQAKATKDDVAPALAAAEWEFRKNNLDKAAAILEDTVKHHPRNEQVYRDLAYLQLSQDKRDQARQTVDEGLKVAPDSFALRVLQTDLLLDRKDFAAVAHNIKELRYDWKSPLLDFLEGRLLVEQNKDRQAIQFLEEAATKMDGKWASFNDWCNWPSRVHALLGVAYERLGEQENRLQAMRQATQADPSWDLARFGYGAALLASGLPDDAAKELFATTDKKGVPAGAWTLLSRAVFQDQKNRPAAERDWGQLEELLKTARAKDTEHALELDLLAAEILELRDKSAEARQYLQGLQRPASPHAEQVALTLALANLEARQGHVDKGLSLLAAADKTLTADPDLVAARIRLLAQRGQDEDRRALMKMTEDLGKDKADVQARLFRELALAWQRLGDMSLSQKAWERVAELRPEDIESRQAMLDLALATNQFTQARTLIAQLKDLEKGKGRAWRTASVALALQEAMQGQPEGLPEARNQLEALKAVDPSGPRVPLFEGRIDELEGNFAGALKHYQKAIALGERDPLLVLTTARRLLDRRFQDATAVESARQLLEKFGKGVSSSLEFKRLQAEIAQLDGAAELARTLVNEIVPPGTRDYRALLWKARIQDDIDDGFEAEQTLRQAVKYGTHTPETWMALVQHQAFVEKKPELVEKTLDALKEIVSSRQRDFFLARCYEALGRTADADQAYRRQLDETPSDFLLLWQAAEFYRQAEMFERAKECYQKLIDMGASIPAESLARARRGYALLLAESDPQLGLRLLEPLRARKERTDERLEAILQARLSGQRGDGLKKLSASFAQVPPRPDELLQYARLLAEDDQRESARRAFEQLMRLHKSAPNLTAYLRFLMQDPTGERDRIEQINDELKLRTK